MGEQLYDKGKRFFHSNTAGTTVLTTQPTVLESVTLNFFGAAGAIDIYNGVTTAGQRVASIGTGGINAQTVYHYGVALSGGLTVVVTSTPDFVVTYR